MPDSDTEKAASPAPTPVPSSKRARTVGVVATVAGVLAAVVGLVLVLTTPSGDGDELLYVLLFAGGMLVSVLGLRRLRKTRTS